MRTRGFWMGLGALAVAALLAACGGGGPSGPRLLVNSNGDEAARDGVLTLREAVLLATGELKRSDLDGQESGQVNGEPGAQSADVIAFDGPFQGEEAIVLSEPLPALAGGNDRIDGSEAGGVVIDGKDRTFTCIELSSSGNAVLGLQLTGCRTAILVDEQAEANHIGGPGAGEGNVISGNVVGIEMRGRGNFVQGNLIGIDAAGIEAVGNEFEGIWVTPLGRENVIGGPNPGEGNVISGNELFGLSIDGATGNVVQGNFIGLDRSGAQGVPNQYGITVQAGATGNVIGGAEAEERNVISANNIGLLLRDAGTSGNTARGNYFGTDASGGTAIANTVDIWEKDDVGENVLEENQLSDQR